MLTDGKITKKITIRDRIDKLSRESTIIAWKKRVIDFTWLKKMIFWAFILIDGKYSTEVTIF
jgi:hypothetical protein